MRRTESPAGARRDAANPPGAGDDGFRDCGRGFQCRCMEHRPATRSKAESSLSVGCVGEPAFHAIGISGKAFAQLGKAPWARFAGQNASLRIALGEDERFSAGRSARIEDGFDLAAGILSGICGELSDQLRTFILQARAAFAKRCRCRDVAGNDGAGGGEDGCRVEGSTPAPINSASTAGFTRRMVRAGWTWPWRQRLAPPRGHRSVSIAQRATQGGRRSMRVRLRFPQGLKPFRILRCFRHD